MVALLLLFLGTIVQGEHIFDFSFLITQFHKAKVIFISYLDSSDVYGQRIYFGSGISSCSAKGKSIVKLMVKIVMMTIMMMMMILVLTVSVPCFGHLIG